MEHWKNLFGNKFRVALAVILIAEMASFVAYYFQVIDIVFFAVLALVVATTIYNLGLGLLIALAELITGSMGYLFYTEMAGIEISLRIGIWLTVILVWAGQEIYNLVYNKWSGININKQLKQTIKELQKNYIAYFIVLFIFIGWGAIQGYLYGNTPGNLFSDLNGYLFLFLIFPAYKVASRYQGIVRHSYFTSTLLQVFTAGLTWATLKSLTLLFIFSHGAGFDLDLIYDWIRDTGVGEITEMQEGIYRIFLQSHIFVVIGFLLFLFILNSYLFRHHRTFKEFLFTHKIKTFFLFVYTAALSAVIITGFSRSLWVGTIVGLLLWMFFTIQEYGWKKLGISLVNLTVIVLLGFGLIGAVISFPYPPPTGQYSTGKALSSRTQQTAHSGAAVSSRWMLLPAMWNKIKEGPILGQGFGTTITYTSSDPRVLEQDPEGTYTTFAFEWGWLDIWLKMGIAGLMCYIMILGKIFFEGFRAKHKRKLVAASLATGIAVVAAVNFFTPYLNHPLGIGYLILTALFIDKLKQRI